MMRLLSAKSVRHAQVISIVGGLFSLSMAVPPVLLGIVGVSTSKFRAVIKDLRNTVEPSYKDHLWERAKVVFIARGPDSETIPTHQDFTRG